MLSFFDKFSAFLLAKQLLQPKERCLVAVSGGMDSVALCHLLAATKFHFSIAHCNFQLRGEASDSDEFFVQNLAKQLAVPHYSTRFEIKKYAAEQRMSIQEAARKLRYDWFQELLETADCQRIATAHHLDDSIETVLFNFAKGCGIRGLHGIPPKAGNIVRPLLFATKREIQQWIDEQKIEFREDASNATDFYARNLIRHQAVPVFEKINPAFQKSAGESIGRVQEAEALFAFAVAQILQSILEKTPDGWQLDTRKLLACPAPATVLFEWLRPLGFDGEQVRQIFQIITPNPSSATDTPPPNWGSAAHSGKIFHATSGRLLIDRFFMILKSEENTGGVINMDAIQATPIPLPSGSSLHFRQFDLPMPEQSGFEFAGDPAIACFDAERLKFPLHLRHWQPGDVFQPLGMGGRSQKLQDFFSNRKLNLFEKEQVWLLESDGKICWVVGMRIDERFKVVENTKSCLEVVLHNGTFADK